ncbi:MAG: hypothetical protein WCG30_00575 [Candidatus Saccharibacteria bacterium]
MRYIVAALLSIGLLVTVIVLIVHGLNGPSSSKKPISMSSQFNTPVDIRFVKDGIINNNNLHRSISITVNKDNINMTIFQGYEGNVIGNYNYPNNPNSYKNFLGSLGSLGYMQKRSSSYKSVNGLCPLGLRYSYFIEKSSNNMNQDLWSTDCGNGTMAGQIGPIQQVIQNQIPNYNVLTQNIDLRQNAIQS